MKCIPILLVAVAAVAQEPSFEIESRLVLVPVTVVDSKGRSVEGLGEADFRLLDNGRPRAVQVDTFATGVAPIALVMAVQSSGISEPALQKVRTVGGMIQPLVTGERGCAGVLSFNERVDWLQDCTNDAGKIENAFRRLKAGEPKAARMLDGAYEGIKYLAKRPNVRRVLLLVSESRDRGSEADLQTVAEAARAAGVAIYAITYSAFATGFTTTSQPQARVPVEERPRSTRTEPLGPAGRVPIPTPDQRVDILGGIIELVRLGKTKAADALADATGGAALSFTRKRGLEEAIEKFGAELHAQYVLSFAPSGDEPGLHTVEVLLRGNRKWSVRARPAYWASAPARL